ncbi:GNAT family N-acetyltransferase [Paeniglutamicibacter antarcticus]|uniref:N-acetyltransferase domain-containing protein n=1 Tax=Paeniglutamicibacter antarcticus TaxID=494023 RepID=A0ABP9TLC0_9MICC
MVEKTWEQSFQELSHISSTPHTRVGSRSRGYGRSVVRSLIEEASRRNLEEIWLQVAESNSVALGLYGSLGFETISGYHYRQAPGAEPTGDPSPLLRLGS